MLFGLLQNICFFKLLLISDVKKNEFLVIITPHDMKALHLKNEFHTTITLHDRKALPLRNYTTQACQLNN